MQYSFIFFLTVKSVLVYSADITILVLMITSGVFNGNVDCGNSTSAGAVNPASGVSTTDLTRGFGALFCTNSQSVTAVLAPKQARPWIMLASVVMSLILLLLDWRKGRIVILSRDISYSLTNHVAYRYYVLKSYPHYCFFAEILNSRKTVDVLAFFVFFAFKSWKRLFLAEFPRVYINVLNMYDVLKGLIPANNHDNAFLQYATAIGTLFANRANNGAALATLILSAFTITMWFFSFCVIVAAFFMYFPLLYIVRGNLKEYVCHKIDKRISELLKKKSRKRTEEARKAELAELERMAQLKERAKNGQIDADPDALAFKAAAPLGLSVRPTLPDIDVDLDATTDFDGMSNYGSNYSQSEFGTQRSRGFGGPPPPPHGFPPGMVPPPGMPPFVMGPNGAPIMPPPGMVGPFSPSGNPLPSSGFLPPIGYIQPGPPPMRPGSPGASQYSSQLPPPRPGSPGGPNQYASPPPPGFPSLPRSNNSDSPSGESGNFNVGNYPAQQPLLQNQGPNGEAIPLRNMGGYRMGDDVMSVRSGGSGRAGLATGYGSNPSIRSAPAPGGAYRVPAPPH
ncbi:hypothetical protein BC830DRAFT_1158665, partial [Chytriomyces sp. MP71]